MTWLGILSVLLSTLTTFHILLYKKETPSAAAWICLVWLSPIVGVVLYTLIGINRVKRKGSALRSKGLSATDQKRQSELRRPTELGEHRDLLPSLVNVGDAANPRPLVAGNSIEPLFGGDQAYPQMLDAIGRAKGSIALASYIFDTDEVGELFALALSEAVKRGVETRVLVDDVGSLYSFPPIDRRLKKLGVKVAKFLPAWLPGDVHLLNLRNHRKLLVIDGREAFMGGMNIRIGHWLSKHPKNPVRDVEFRVQGPVVCQLQEVFADDWAFTTNETLSGERWFPQLESHSEGLSARAMPDGPDKHVERTKWLILGALASAQKSVRIMTPYFTPEPEILAALNTAAMRGIVVDLVIPEKTNIPWCTWAAQAVLWEIVEKGVRVWLAPAPFEHTKIMIVDGQWSLIGSSNWDVRSLRLNFELNLECYGRALATDLAVHIDAQIALARRLLAAEIEHRSLGLRLRDGFARLYSPVL